jgi:hypothetical protein
MEFSQTGEELPQQEPTLMGTHSMKLCWQVCPVEG